MGEGFHGPRPQEILSLKTQWASCAARFHSTLTFSITIKFARYLARPVLELGWPSFDAVVV
jgi:hypothetical protein